MRHDAACAASLAATGKGKDVDKLQDEDRAKFRKQALDWLRADLTLCRKQNQSRNVKEAILLSEKLPQWQRNPNLAGVRDPKELAGLTKEEQEPWQQLWTDLAQLVKEVRARFVVTQRQGTLTAKQTKQIYEVKLFAGKTYIVDLESKQFDAYLRLEDAKGKVLAENDDISPTNQNSRIVFSASKDGAYRIVATSFETRGAGAYTMTVREFVVKSVDAKWDDIRTGKARPENAAEAISFAGQWIKERHYALATRLYREAFRKEPALSDNLDLGHRYNAACYAVLAGQAKGTTRPN